MMRILIALVVLAMSCSGKSDSGNCPPYSVCADSNPEGRLCRQCVCIDGYRNIGNDDIVSCEAIPPCVDLTCNEQGATGNTNPNPTLSGECFCQTKPGYFYQNEKIHPCDKDEDGWVRHTAQSAIESNDDEIRANARCSVNTITSFVLYPDKVHSGLPQTSSISVSIQKPGFPMFEPEAIDSDNRWNALTKACGDDANQNGIDDVREYYNEYVTLPSFSYFVELYQGYFQPTTGIFHIHERPRQSDDFPLGYVEQQQSIGGDGDEAWRSCLRVAEDDVPFGIFLGMGHSSQFKCFKISPPTETPQVTPNWLLSTTDAQNKFIHDDNYSSASFRANTCNIRETLKEGDVHVTCTTLNRIPDEPAYLWGATRITPLNTLPAEGCVDECMQTSLSCSQSSCVGSRESFGKIKCSCEDGQLCECLPGEVDQETCGLGPTNYSTTCSPRQRVCTENYTWGDCEGENKAISEDCRSENDDDCDGYINLDDSDDCGACLVGSRPTPCGTPLWNGNACVLGSAECVLSEEGIGQRSSCNPAGEQSPEICDGQNLDEDCDGAVDLGYIKSDGTIVSRDIDCECILGETDDKGCAGSTWSSSANRCLTNQRTCVNNPSGVGTIWGACEPRGIDTPEICDGQNLDEDCDGSVDLGYTNSDGIFVSRDIDCECILGETDNCTGLTWSPSANTCLANQRTCVSNPSGVGTIWGACEPRGIDTPEVCDGRNLDEDCDGAVDLGDSECLCINGEERSCAHSISCNYSVQRCRNGSWGVCEQNGDRRRNWRFDADGDTIGGGPEVRSCNSPGAGWVIHRPDIPPDICNQNALSFYGSGYYGEVEACPAGGFDYNQNGVIERRYRSIGVNLSEDCLNYTPLQTESNYSWLCPNTLPINICDRCPAPNTRFGTARTLGCGQTGFMIVSCRQAADYCIVETAKEERIQPCK